MKAIIWQKLQNVPHNPHENEIKRDWNNRYHMLFRSVTLQLEILNIFGFNYHDD